MSWIGAGKLLPIFSTVKKAALMTIQRVLIDYRDDILYKKQTFDHMNPNKMYSGNNFPNDLNKKIVLSLWSDVYWSWKRVEKLIFYSVFICRLHLIMPLHNRTEFSAWKLNCSHTRLCSNCHWKRKWNMCRVICHPNKVLLEHCTRFVHFFCRSLKKWWILKFAFLIEFQDNNNSIDGKKLRASKRSWAQNNLDFAMIQPQYFIAFPAILIKNGVLVVQHFYFKIWIMTMRWKEKCICRTWKARPAYS